MIRVTFHLSFLGTTQPVELLRFLVYTAAKLGSQEFLEAIFNSSAGRVVFEAYKASSKLPEVIAKEFGHEETAHYLEDITKRYLFRRMRKTVLLDRKFVHIQLFR